jgi:hypothetical protein
MPGNFVRGETGSCGCTGFPKPRGALGSVVAGEGYQMKITAVRRILETRMSART